MASKKFDGVISSRGRQRAKQARLKGKPTESARLEDAGRQDREAAAARKST